MGRVGTWVGVLGIRFNSILLYPIWLVKVKGDFNQFFRGFRTEQWFFPSVVDECLYAMYGKYLSPKST